MPAVSAKAKSNTVYVPQESAGQVLDAAQGAAGGAYNQAFTQATVDLVNQMRQTLINAGLAT